MSLNKLPNVHICLIHPPGYLHADALLDPALFFKYQFERFSIDVSFERNELRHGVVNFVFGAHNGFNAEFGKLYSCILVNLEQIGRGGANLSQTYFDLISRGIVVDYDAANPIEYSAYPNDIPIARFGFAPYLASDEYIPLEDRPIDLLFFGSMNLRRRQVINCIEATGRKVTVAPFPLYGPERDALIRKAKAVVNIPFYETARFEQIRAFLCLSLGTPVLSERLTSISPSENFDDYVTWFDNSHIDQLFGKKFGTHDFYDEMRTKVALFQHADPLDEFAELMIFASGVWQLHSQMLIGKTARNATLKFKQAVQPTVTEPEIGVISRNPV
jgi:hypothetical protein